MQKAIHVPARARQNRAYPATSGGAERKKRRDQRVISRQEICCVTVEGFPPGCALIEIHVADVKQLFHSLDPTPFRERDLDPKAEEFIAGWARELHTNVPLGLRVHADRETEPDDTKVLQGAVRDYFAVRAEATRKRLRQLFRTGRVSLVIGLTVVAGSIIIGDVVESMLRESQWGSVIRESLLIGGWVAMWRPLEIFLYEWWPIRDEARLFDRLSRMIVRVERSNQ